MAATPIDPDEDLDDDALSWEGDDELGRGTSLTEVRRGGRSRSRTLPDEDALRWEGDDDLDEADESEPRASDVDAEFVPRDVPRSVGTVLFGALFLVYTVGWVLTVVGVGNEIGVNTGVTVLDFAGRITQFLGLVSAALWFVAVVQLTRDSRTRFRLGWLAVGAALLVPWPALLGYLS